MLIVLLLVLVLISMILNLKHYFSLKQTFTSINKKYQSHSADVLAVPLSAGVSTSSEHDRLHKISN